MIPEPYRDIEIGTQISLTNNHWGVGMILLVTSEPEDDGTGVFHEGVVKQQLATPKCHFDANYGSGAGDTVHLIGDDSRLLVAFSRPAAKHGIVNVAMLDDCEIPEGGDGSD